MKRSIPHVRHATEGCAQHDDDEGRSGVGILGRFERKLEGAVDDGFARVFGGQVVPHEVERALARQAEDSR